MAKSTTRSIRLTRAVEEKHIGMAPSFENANAISDDEMSYLIQMGLRHYGYFYASKDAMKWMINWLKSYRKWDDNAIAEYMALEDWKTSMTLCVLARMHTEGARIPEKHLAQMIDRTNTLRVEGKSILDTREMDEMQKSTGHKVTIQDRLRTKADIIISEIDARIDTWMQTNRSKSIQFDFYKHMRIEGYPANQIKRIGLAFGLLYDELTELTESKKPDAELIEGYGHLTRPQIKRLHVFIEKVIADAEMYAAEAKVTRKPRKKKVVPADKIVAKLQFKMKDEKLNLVSVKPTDILGATVLWVFNSKTRKLGRYVAEENEILQIKGTSIINFDEKRSIQKTIRKPDIVLKGFTKIGKVKLRKFLDEIKAVDTKLRSRINGDVILLKVQ